MCLSNLDLKLLMVSCARWSGVRRKHKVSFFSRVVHQIGIFRSVSVGISWYLPYRYQRKSWSVHVGILFLVGTPFSLIKGALASFLREKGGTSPLFDTASPPFEEKRSSRQISNTHRKYRQPNKSDTGKYRYQKNCW